MTGEVTTQPFPDNTLKETVTPWTGCPELSNTTTVGADDTAVDAVASCPLPDTIWMTAGRGSDGTAVPCDPQESAAMSRIQRIRGIREAIE